MTALRAATAAGIVVTLWAAAACSPERLRPGPPSIAIEVPQGSVVGSPDTILIEVTVFDPNGLSSAEITFLGVTEPIDVGLGEVEARGLFAWPVDAGLPPGIVLTITVRAVDLTGATAVREATVTVAESALTGGT